MKCFILSLLILAVIFTLSAVTSSASIKVLTELHELALTSYDAENSMRANLTEELRERFEAGKFTLSISLYGNDLKDVADMTIVLAELCRGEYEESEYRVTCSLLIDELEMLRGKLTVSPEGVL
ncbi:MAG: hypothetical protein LUH54_02345 [Firmicutes bacterium]|nr:hypothetical protein [Bacillota bacterium]